jgi:hypothetical protein
MAIALTDGPDIDGNKRMFNPVRVFFSNKESTYG